MTGSAALLEDGWVHRRVDEEFSAIWDTVTSLRIESFEQHRSHRPVWQTQLRGSLVGLLNDPVGSSGFEFIDTIGTADPGLAVVEAEDTKRYLSMLPAKAREIFLLLIEDYAYPDIAERLGYPVNTVRVIVCRARRQLAEERDRRQLAEELGGVVGGRR